MAAWHDVVLNVVAMVAITLLLMVLLWPNSERFLRLVCLVVAACVLILVLEPNSR